MGLIGVDLGRTQSGLVRTAIKEILEFEQEAIHFLQPTFGDGKEVVGATSVFDSRVDSHFI